MVYLPTFTIQINQNVDKHTRHEWYGKYISFCNFLHLNTDFPAMVTSQSAFFVTQVSQLTVHLQNDEVNQSTEPRQKKNTLFSMKYWLFNSKISPTHPWKIPRMFHHQFMKEFLSLWWLGKSGVSSQGMWAKSLINRYPYFMVYINNPHITG